MKKFLLYASAVSAMMLAGSCQKEVLNPVSEGEASVKFSIALPDGLQTKAMSKAESTDIVYYEIWNSNWSRQLYPVEEAGVQSAYASAEVKGCKATIDLKLISDQTYNFIFWAQNEGCGAYDVTELKNVGVNYDVIGAEGNQDKFDAFYAVKTIKVEGPVNETITLYRPFAQLNFGADEMTTTFGNIEVTDTEIEVSGLATVFNTLTGSGEQAVTSPVTFKANGIATDEILSTGGKSYTWVTMDYMLMMEKQALVNVEASFGVKDMDLPVTHSLTNVPLKKNYRTNVVGDLFTTDAKLQIVVDPDFNQPDMLIGEAWSRVDDFTYVINAGAPAGTLKAVLAEADAQARALATKAEDIIVTIDLAGDVDWVTEASHGSSPLLPAESLIARVVINGNGKTFTATGSGVGSIRLANMAVLEFNNVNIIDKSVSYNENAWELTYLEFAGLLLFQDCTFNSGIQLQAEDNDILLASFSGCHFISNEADVYCAWVSDGLVGFDGCTFKGTRGLKVHEDYGSEVAGVLVENCEFGPMSKKPGIALGTLNADTEIHVLNSKFIDCQAGDQGLYIYETDTDVNTFEFTSKNNTIISTIEPVVQEDGSVVVACADALQQAVDAAAEGTTVIKLAADIAGDVVVAQKPNVNILLDGAGNNYEGVITVDGKSATYTTAGLALSNLVFNAEAISADACIRLGDGTPATRYACNVTVDNCTFDVSGAVGVKSYTGGDKNLAIIGCTATEKAHSLVQVAGVDAVVVDKCTVNSKNGMNFNSSVKVTINECNADVKGYAARFGAGSSANGAAETYAITGSTLKSACQDGDAVIILRGTADKSTLTITNTTLEGTTKITNNAVDAQVIE